MQHSSFVKSELHLLPNRIISNIQYLHIIQYDALELKDIDQFEKDCHFKQIS